MEISFIFGWMEISAHVLNLIVQDGLSVISSAIGNIRETVKYVNGSTSRKEKKFMIGSRVAYQVHICTKNYSCYLYISFLILFLFQTAEPRGVEVDIPTC